jgi:hypothetical protein
MILTVENIADLTNRLDQYRESHEELRQLATLKETEAAIAWAANRDVQTKLIEMQTALLQQQEMIQALLTNLAAGKG